MANNINNTNNHLKNEIEKKQNEDNGTFLVDLLTVGCLLIMMFLAMSSTSTNGNSDLAKLFFFLGVVFGIIGNVKRKNNVKVKNDINKIKSGLEGELKTNTVLNNLSNDYNIISDLEVKTKNGLFGQLDTVIVSKFGVFIVEIKNLKGVISGNTENKNLTQTKKDSKGQDHISEFYSPVKQVNTHTYKLAELFKENDIRTHIKNAVFFSNNDCELEVKNTTTTPMFAYNSSKGFDLLDYVGNEDKSVLSEEEVVKIKNLLAQYIIKK